MSNRVLGSSDRHSILRVQNVIDLNRDFTPEQQQHLSRRMDELLYELDYQPKSLVDLWRHKIEMRRLDRQRLAEYNRLFPGKKPSRFNALANIITGWI